MSTPRPFSSACRITAACCRTWLEVGTSSVKRSGVAPRARMPPGPDRRQPRWSSARAAAAVSNGSWRIESLQIHCIRLVAPTATSANGPNTDWTMVRRSTAIASARRTSRSANSGRR